MLMIIQYELSYDRHSQILASPGAINRASCTLISLVGISYEPNNTQQLHSQPCIKLHYINYYQSYQANFVEY